MKSKTSSQQLLFDVSEINWEYETQRIINELRDKGILMAYIDLFCGAGGTSTGVEEAMYEMRKMAYVILGINHDRVAIESHKANHPETLHLIEDIRHVNLRPINKMVRAIRAALPYIKIVLWGSAECTHHSKAKGGDSRDADSRSLPEEFYRYDEAIKPDLLQVENVTDFRTWGPIIHKHSDVSHIDKSTCIKKKTEFGLLYSDTGGKHWFNAEGYWFKKEKTQPIEVWMIPDKTKKEVFFKEWVEHLKGLGYTYDDRDLNSADYGAFTSRIRYFGQFARNGMPILWPVKTHAKNPHKLDASIYGHLKPYKPVSEVLDFDDKGESLFEPGRITADATFERILKGAIKFIAGDGDIKKGQADYEKRKEDFAFIQNYHGGGAGKSDRTHSVEEPSRNIDTNNRYALTTLQFANENIHTVFPFIIQFNNNNTGNSVDDSNPVLTTKEKFALTQTEFITKHYGGHPESKSISLNGPAGTITTIDGQAFVSAQNIEEIIPFISTYHGNGHNCSSVTEPSPVVPAADCNALIQPQSFIFRQYNKGGGHLNDIHAPVGSIPTVPKMNLISPVGWVMNTNFKNIGIPLSEPVKTLLASRRHSYLINPSYGGNASDTNKPSPVVVARQDKAPLSLCQIEYDGGSCYGLMVFKTDSKAIRELKHFMALYNIVDIKMRMLKVSELLLIQGFPKGYRLKGTLTDQKKFVGNSVEVKTARNLVECYGPYLTHSYNKYLLAA